ncbi:SusC/RagA family TonB-linked outer membrane protein [Sphingobacterium lumbrici]|uniref:SusC/RagA family TonB-linked outer membrane protein n=1 Tax=Sphingobacterium lumbrici TaxID=2559600 RepID=UPI0015E277FF|nr:SusC/RagA family TonB-linked outer membrane protein [Sphingobacterium lumbrici]
MKLTLLFSWFFAAQVFATSFAQTVNLRVQNASLKSVLLELRKQTNYSFIIQNEQLKIAKPISVDIQNQPVQRALELIFKDQELDFEIEGKVITLFMQKNNINPAKINDSIKNIPQDSIGGRVIDELGQGIAGVSIKVVRKNYQTTTNAKGVFKLALEPGDQVEFSYIGFSTAKIIFSSIESIQHFRSIVLKQAEADIAEVIVTGTGIIRNKQSFTGATSSFTGKELKMVNNQNIIQSLRALDPSFIQVENNALGSNPNALPTIEVRGQTSIPSSSIRSEFSSDPNLPLFILDGFESNLRTIMDLDMNMVASVTILKDASSTALYGSRASNGVVVVETTKPKAGKVTLSYTSDLQLEMSDLRSYNMMNASEKLEFERLSGRYISTNVDGQLTLDSLYNWRLGNVVRGVNTYWMDKPLQTGFSHRHSLNVRGGEGAVLFDFGANYKDTKGVMLGSGRNDWGASLNLGYRHKQLNVSNRTYIVGYNSEESPYGSFSTWVNTNPYYELMGDNVKYLSGDFVSTGAFPAISNPMYNARLNSFSIANSYTLINNLQIMYDVNSRLRFTIGGQLSKGNYLSDDFVSPLHTQFETTEAARKGRLTRGINNPFNYTGNIMATYAVVFADKHSITSNVRAEISENKNQSDGYTVIGFQPGTNGNPAFAFGFAENSKPRTSTQIARRNSILASLNYSFDQRYNLDLNFNIDGSTAFGSNNLYSPYYSAGAGWNIHNESFLKNIEWISMWRLRANMGMTGNQNFGNVSESIYNYYPDNNSYGQGIYLGTLGAPDLEWQRTLQTSIGTDLSLFRNRLNIQLNAYRKRTEPLVVEASFPSSTGVGTYPFNAGLLDAEGVETMISYSPIYRPQDQVVLTFGMTGSMVRMQFDKFDNRLKTLNESLQNSKSIQRYKDGYSPKDIWAVPSKGIDPATGRELFLAKDGQQVFIYNTDDIIRVGTSEPLAEGTFRSSLNYKGLQASAIVRYIWQKDQMNSALYNKVENISSANLESNKDKRALYDRWKQIGDISQFKAISSVISTPMSSRFIQTENTLSLESLSLGYEFRDKLWLNAVALSNLRITGFMNDILYFSSIRRERGINYPFGRSVSMSISATFK